MLIGQGFSATQAAGQVGLSESGLRGARRRALNHPSHPEVNGNPSEGFVEIPVFFRDYSHLPSLRVYPLSDVHVGSPAHARDRWTEWLGYLGAQDDVSLILNGDLFNAALKTSKSESYDEALTVGKAKRQLRRDLEPVRDKIDLTVKGNHEHRVYTAVGDCPLEDLADSLGVPYTSTAAVLVYQVGDVEYDIYVRHGTGNAGGTIGARANALAKGAHVVVADVYINGHVHSQLVATDNYFVRLDGQMVRRRRIYMCSGSFLNYEGYAAERGYVAGRIGAPRLWLDGSRKDAHVSV